MGREDTTYYQEAEDYSYEADGYYFEEDYMYAEEDEDGNLYYYYPSEEAEYEETTHRPDSEARGVAAKPNENPAVGSVGMAQHSTKTQEGDKPKEQPQLFHLL